ncbi:MAG: AI-2E family transporter [Algicola sp.]|nr:AI-2E family transporter [Algicola sp.]
MYEFLSAWYKRKFSDPESVTLFLLLVIGSLTLYFVGHVMVPVLVAIVIAYLLEWPVAKMTRMGASRTAATAVVLLIFVSVSIAVMVGLVPIFWQQGSNLISEAPAMLEQGKNYLNLLPEKYPQLISKEQIQLIMSTVDGGIVEIGQKAISVSFSTLRDLVALLIYLILVPLMIFFMLKDKTVLVESFKSLLPSTRRLITQVSNEMDIQIMNYIRGKLIELVVVGFATYIVLAIFDMRYAALFGLLVGLSVLVPFIGAAVVTIPVVLVGLAQWGVSPEFWYAMIAYGVVQALDGNLLVPLLFSEAVDLNPVYIIIAVLFFGGVWGFWGVFFAIPLAALVKALLGAWSTPKEVGATDVA